MVTGRHVAQFVGKVANFIIAHASILRIVRSIVLSKFVGSLTFVLKQIGQIQHEFALCFFLGKDFFIVQIIDPLLEETHYWGMDCEPNLRAIDIWIGDERYLNRGYGTQIMKQILRGPFVFGDPNVTGVIIDPMADNCAAHRFYQRLGFQPIGIRYFGPDRCLVHRMYRSDSNYY